MKKISLSVLTLLFTFQLAQAQEIAPAEPTPKAPGVNDPGKLPEAAPPLGKKNQLKNSNPLLPKNVRANKHHPIVDDDSSPSAE